MHTQPDTQPSLVFKGVSAGYTVAPVFEDFSLTLQGPGSFHIRGPNGAGKSTFIELVSGYLKPWRGSISVGGSPANTEEARQLRAVCRTQPATYSNMTAHDHLYLAARTAAVEPERLLERADAYGLSPWLHNQAQSLSTGNRRKLWLLMCTPALRPVTALDEPFDGLDQEGVQILLKEIREWAEAGLVLVVAHQAPPGMFFRGAVDLPNPLSRAYQSDADAAASGQGGAS